MSHTALATNLTGTSSRAVTEIIAAILADFDFASPQKQTYIVDKK